MLYLTYGTQQVMERGFRDLDQRLELYLDGVRAELPSIESVVVLNIPSWGAGVHLWDMGASMLNVFHVSYMKIKETFLSL
jgi:diacylglycerol kinase (ATP)